MTIIRTDWLQQKQFSTVAIDLFSVRWTQLICASIGKVCIVSCKTRFKATTTDSTLFTWQYRSLRATPVQVINWPSIDSQVITFIPDESLTPFFTFFVTFQSIYFFLKWEINSNNRNQFLVFKWSEVKQYVAMTIIAMIVNLIFFSLIFIYLSFDEWIHQRNHQHHFSYHHSLLRTIHIVKRNASPNFHYSAITSCMWPYFSTPSLSFSHHYQLQHTNRTNIFLDSVSVTQKIDKYKTGSKTCNRIIDNVLP